MFRGFKIRWCNTFSDCASPTGCWTWSRFIDRCCSWTPTAAQHASGVDGSEGWAGCAAQITAVPWESVDDVVSLVTFQANPLLEPCLTRSFAGRRPQRTEKPSLQNSNLIHVIRRFLWLTQTGKNHDQYSKKRSQKWGCNLGNYIRLNCLQPQPSPFGIQTAGKNQPRKFDIIWLDN